MMEKLIKSLSRRQVTCLKDMKRFDLPYRWMRKTCQALLEKELVERIDAETYQLTALGRAVTAKL